MLEDGVYFDNIMSAPVKSFSDYPNDAFGWRTFASVAKFARKKALHTGGDNT